MRSSAEIKSAMNELYERWQAGDAGFVEDMLTTGDEIILIGTDPDEWWSGRDNVVKIWRTQFEEMGGIKFTPGDLTAREQGDVGFAVDNPTLRMPDGTEAQMRITSVFAREDGRWRIVHAHASVGVTNEEAIGKELTT